MFLLGLHISPSGDHFFTFFPPKKKNNTYDVSSVAYVHPPLVTSFFLYFPPSYRKKIADPPIYSKQTVFSLNNNRQY